MYASIRDGTLLGGGFASISEGLQALGIASIELGIDREYQVAAIKPTTSKTNFVLTSESAVQEYKKHLEQAGAVNLSNPHHLFNPVKWQKRPDNSIIKIQSGKEIGPYALSVAAIRSLHRIIAVDRPAGPLSYGPGCFRR